MRPSLRTDRRGIALALALFATVIATLIITAVFYVARLEQRMGNNRIASMQAREAAETGLAAVLANWSTATYNTLGTGATVPIAQTSVGGGATYTGVVRRLTPTTFLLTMNGEYRIGGAVMTRRQLARIVRLSTPSINMNAAVTTRNGITVSGSSQVSGVDSIPASWGGQCPPAGPTRPGIRDSSGLVTTSGACSGASCITGSPQILTDPTINSNTFDTFGDLNFNDLASLADKVVGGTVTGVAPTFNSGPPLSCRTGDVINWGDPLNPTSVCGNYYPVIYSPGDLRLSGGWGQGILLVGGDLEIAGGMEFYGPVIVQGRIRSTGTGGHIYGGLMAANADFSVNLLSGNSVVNFSTCTINRALNGSAKAKPIRERSWAQVY